MSQVNSDDMPDAGGALIAVGDDQEEMFAQPQEDYDPTPMVQQVNYSKQGFNIYSMLLALSFFFLLIATIMFFVEVGRFG